MRHDGRLFGRIYKEASINVASGFSRTIRSHRMGSAIRRAATTAAVASASVVALMFTAHGQSKIACDADNGGITLPQGFCALVVADDVGTARHMAVAPNGDLYVATQTRGARGGPQTGGGVIALRDTDGDGKFDVREQISTG